MSERPQPRHRHQRWLLLALGLATSTLAAQQVFRGRVNLVRVDVSVIDNRTGKPVTDLKAEDFTVTENGTPQRIDAFAFDDGGVRRGTSEAPGQDGRGTLTPHSRRVFLIIFGHPSLAGPYHPFDGTVRFIRERLHPGDLISILAFNRFTELTTDHDAVVRLVERIKSSHAEEYFQVGIASPARGLRADIPPVRQEAIDRVMAPAGEGLKLRSVTDLILNSSAFVQTHAWRAWNRIAMGYDSLKIHAAIEYLRRVEGNKQLVLFSKGLTLPVKILGMPPGLLHQDRDDDVRLARRARMQASR